MWYKKGNNRCDKAKIINVHFGNAGSTLTFYCRIWIFSELQNFNTEGPKTATEIFECSQNNRAFSEYANAKTLIYYWPKFKGVIKSKHLILSLSIFPLSLSPSLYLSISLFLSFFLSSNLKSRIQIFENDCSKPTNYFLKNF